ncbi:hypothetical protein AB0I49_19655 [Streptomyces sp. NPDC050617]
MAVRIAVRIDVRASVERVDESSRHAVIAERFTVADSASRKETR